MQIESNFEVSKDYINNINLVRSLFFYLADLENDFINILEFNKKNKIDRVKLGKDSILIKDALRNIDNFIQEIKNEPY